MCPRAIRAVCPRGAAPLPPPPSRPRRPERADDTAGGENSFPARLSGPGGQLEPFIIHVLTERNKGAVLDARDEVQKMENKRRTPPLAIVFTERGDTDGIGKQVTRG